MGELIDLRKLAEDSRSKIFAARAQAELLEPRRTYLGCSVIGKACERAIWYGYRWAFHPAGAEADEPETRGRVLRLFDHGKLMEPHIVNALKSIGCTVEEQCEVDLGGGVKGTADGVVFGLPEAPQTPHLLEMKTASSNSFKKAVKEGLRSWQPTYFAQMQLYMMGLELKRGLLVVLNKDNDDLYLERIDYEADFAIAELEKARGVINADEAPHRIGGPDHSACKYCDWRKGCHGTEQKPIRNCRTCTEWQSVSGVGVCQLLKRVCNDLEPIGCAQHRFLPSLINDGRVVSVQDQKRSVKYEMADERSGDSVTWTDNGPEWA